MFQCRKSIERHYSAPATEHKFPKEFEGFGWCTWNAYYKEVTSQKIYEKLEEFKSKGIKLSWLLVDAGWLSIEDMKLLSFKEDKEKFPEGFKGFTKKVKEEYGVKYVGVWHTFAGNWCGFHEDGEIYRDYKDLLFKTDTGWIFPSYDEEKAFKLWDIWHSYLKEQGIDFVKVDNQSASSPKYDYLMPIVTPEGDIWHFDYAAKVTKDLFYTECSNAEMPLKVWNKSSDNFVLAAFGITVDKTVNGSFKLSDIPGTANRYLVHDFFNDKYFVLDKDSVGYYTCNSNSDNKEILVFMYD